MEFTFSIRETLKSSWALFKKHVWFFVGIAAVSVVLNFIGGGKHVPFVIEFILMVATFLWSIIVMKFSLAAADNKEELLSFKSVQAMLPSWQQFLGMLGVAIMTALLVLGGFILLIIPGIWIAFRLSVSNLAYLDKGQGVMKSLRTSWDMTKGSIFWTVVLVGIVSGALYLVGILLFGVGILVTYPLAMLLMAKFYRALTVHHGHSASTVVVQPAEIVAPVEAKPEEHHHESETPNQ